MQPLDQQFVDVAVRGELHEVGGERHHQEDVDTELLGKLGSSSQRGQLGGMAAREHHFHRVRIEGHQHRGNTAGPAGLDSSRDQFGVSAVDTVEDPDRQDAATPVRGDVVLPAPALHVPKPNGGSARQSAWSTSVA